MNASPEALQLLLDKQAILECVHRYARGIDRAEPDLVASCYHPDAIDHHGSYVGTGRGLAEWAIRAHSHTARSQNHITTHTVEVDGDSAHGETYFLVLMRTPSGSMQISTGRYVDRFERRNGEWRIAARLCLVESLARADAYDGERLDAAYPGSRSVADPSYHRPLVLGASASDWPSVGEQSADRNSIDTSSLDAEAL
jgi:ketosteroid isomerase-like protein